MIGLYEDAQDIAHNKTIAREVLKKHGKHKASQQLLPAFLFLLEMGEVEWEIDDDNDVWWFFKEKEEG